MTTQPLSALTMLLSRHTRRRAFITLLGGAVAWPLAARAQQAAMPVVGFLNGASPDGYVPMVAAFRQGLKEAGYLEGQNVAVEYRWAEGQYDRVPEIALELVGRQVAVIVANTPGVLALKAAITTTPIVFTTSSDPVQIGLVASMSRSGGNITGATTLAGELAPKRLELAHELVPTASVIAALINPTNRNTAEPQLRDLQAAAHTFGLQLRIVHASIERCRDPSFQTDITRRFEKDAMISAVRPSVGLEQRASLNQCQHEGLKHAQNPSPKSLDFDL